jgi:hypothetical protein
MRLNSPKSAAGGQCTGGSINTLPPQLLKMWLLGQAFDPSSCLESTAQIFSPTEQEEMECKTICAVLISQPSDAEPASPLFIGHCFVK